MAAQTGDMLELYQAQLRAHVPARLPAGVTVERDGPLVRTIGFGSYGWVEYRDLGEPSEEQLDRMIEAQVARFADRGEPFEWKFHSHDRPPFLEARLTAAGFVAEDVETVVIADAAALAKRGRGPAPEAVTVREVRDRCEFERIGGLEAAVWGTSGAWYADAFEQELAGDPESLVILVAEAGDVVVAAGWMRFPSGTDFATLWGGATLAGWRGRGIYRALVLERARLAVARGRRYIEVDASADSRPILERLGFEAVTQTRPYVWSPSRVG